MEIGYLGFGFGLGFGLGLGLGLGFAGGFDPGVEPPLDVAATAGDETAMATARAVKNRKHIIVSIPDRWSSVDRLEPKQCFDTDYPESPS